jgi:hypothetical protein
VLLAFEVDSTAGPFCCPALPFPLPRKPNIILRYCRGNYLIVRYESSLQA